MYKYDGFVGSGYNVQIIKCNNKIRWINSSGNIIEEPCFIGWEMSSTNNGVTKDVTIEQRRLVCLIQGNSNTNEIISNQRFLLSKTSAFKVTQVFEIKCSYETCLAIREMCEHTVNEYKEFLEEREPGEFLCLLDTYYGENLIEYLFDMIISIDKLVSAQT